MNRSRFRLPRPLPSISQHVLTLAALVFDNVCLHHSDREKEGVKVSPRKPRGVVPLETKGSMMVASRNAAWIAFSSSALGHSTAERGLCSGCTRIRAKAAVAGRSGGGSWQLEAGQTRRAPLKVQCGRPTIARRWPREQSLCKLELFGGRIAPSRRNGCSQYLHHQVPDVRC